MDNSVPSTIEAQVIINASSSEVWKYLTVPALMKRWIGEDELAIEVITDWSIGSSILVKGFHHQQFENYGIVLECEEEKILRYTQLSSLSGLDDKEENYTVFRFRLERGREMTLLKLNIERFPTDSIFRHLELYWRVTLHAIKETIEKAEADK